MGVSLCEDAKAISLENKSNPALRCGGSAQGLPNVAHRHKVYPKVEVGVSGHFNDWHYAGRVPKVKIYCRGCHVVTM